VGGDVVDVEGAVDAHYGAAPALDVSRRAGVSGRMPFPDTDVVADGVPRRRVGGEIVGQHTAIGARQREVPACPAVEFVLRCEARFDGHRGGAGEPVLVVRRGKVVLGSHPLDRVPEPRRMLRRDPADHQPKGAPFPVFVEERLGCRVLDGTEPIEAAEVVHAIHAVNPTAIESLTIELFDGTDRDYEVRAHMRSSVVVAAIIGIGALAAAPLAPPPEPHAPSSVSREVQLTAAPALGSIPLAFIRNQFQYCSLICPHAVEGAITVPLGAVQAPATFLGTLTSTGSPLKAFGAAAASVTGPANAAVTPLINNDVFLVVPKAFHALDVAVVEAVNVGAAALTPGQFLQAVQTGRANILDALNQPVGTPTTPTGASNIVQVVAVEAINMTTAVAFQAGELLLSGAVQIADASAQELANSGNPASALAAGAAEAGQVAETASAPVVSAVNTAMTNIRNSLHDPFPAAAKTTAGQSVRTLAVKADDPKKPDTLTTTKPPRLTVTVVSESRSGKRDSDATTSPAHPLTLSRTSSNWPRP